VVVMARVVVGCCTPLLQLASGIEMDTTTSSNANGLERFMLSQAL
jgi:hypothetical protein